jgi:hypothetical protein
MIKNVAVSTEINLSLFIANVDEEDRLSQG